LHIVHHDQGILFTRVDSGANNFRQEMNICFGMAAYKGDMGKVGLVFNDRVSVGYRLVGLANGLNTK
ncbi:MAG: hypothetical protein ACK52X_01960, partial [bacterium]